MTEIDTAYMFGKLVGYGIAVLITCKIVEYLRMFGLSKLISGCFIAFTGFVGICAIFAAPNITGTAAAIVCALVIYGTYLFYKETDHRRELDEKEDQDEDETEEP